VRPDLSQRLRALASQPEAGAQHGPLLAAQGIHGLLQQPAVLALDERVLER